jgi:hypothetical protein
MQHRRFQAIACVCQLDVILATRLEYAKWRHQIQLSLAKGMTLYKNWGHMAIYKGHTIASSHCHLVTYVTNFRTHFKLAFKWKKTTQKLARYYGHMYSVTYPTYFYSGLVCSENKQVMEEIPRRHHGLFLRPSMLYSTGWLPQYYPKQ